MSNKLRPCCACGDKEPYIDNSLDVFLVRCWKCKHKTEANYDKLTAIKYWNTQPRIDELTKQIKKLSELVDKIKEAVEEPYEDNEYIVSQVTHILEGEQ